MATRSWGLAFDTKSVRALRAGYARELILGTSLPLKEIAPRAGLGATVVLDVGA